MSAKTIATIKSAFFSYLEAGVASAVILFLNGGVNQPLDLLWAFLAGFIGPIVKALNPLDKALGINTNNLPKPATGDVQTTAIAEDIAAKVTAEVETAVEPAIDAVAKKIVKK